jgi:ATPase, P-type (transporting), HAD superfamily, subfamily IC
MDVTGLTDAEVKERISEGKVNHFESPVSRSYLDIVIKNVCTTFNLILFILGVALLYFEEPISAASATGIIGLNILVATIQEIRAKRRLDKIALLLRPTVNIIRDGEEIQTDPSQIVMDDIIHLASGDQAQVDGEFIDARSMEMDESLLTGESSTVRKKIGDIVYSGAFCVTGEGYFKVTALGEDTFASKMLTSAKKYKRKKTPLQIETSTVTKMLMVMAFVFLVLMVIRGILFGGDGIGASEFAIKSVLVLDIVPIALFLLITITYMIAAVRMANGGVLLQNSNSVESMSHVNTVCMDKTGTITTNDLLFENMESFTTDEEAELAVKRFVFATGSKNRTVKALEEKFGGEEVILTEEIQFTSERKYSAVHIGGDDPHTLFMGAWSSLKKYIGDEDLDNKISKISKKGLRAIVLCRGEDLPLFENDEPAIPDLKLVALISIKDEVRPDCKEIIDEFMNNGMDVKVISGDDPETVNALFSLAGITGKRKIISGEQLSSLEGEELDHKIMETNIFGRMKPDQKEIIIDTLKRNGRYVAMIGDGVNDVRSIKAANVGVALQSGSGAARGVADMILLDDKFSALPKAIVEGKKTVTGMRDILKIYLTRNFILAALILVFLIILGRLPMLPVHNTMYALISVSFAAFLMAIWAKPSDNKELILPDVLRFSIPMAMTICMFGLLVYFIFDQCTSSGIFGLGESFYMEMSDMYWDKGFNDFIGHMTAGAESYAEITARNAMLVFLILAGISQLFLLFPLIKQFSMTGNTTKDLKPTILGILLFGLLALVYEIPQVAVNIGSLAIFPTEYFLLIFGFVILWFFASLQLLKRVSFRKLTEVTETAYKKSLEAELEKSEEDQGT